jgi:hypothetical protein
MTDIMPVEAGLGQFSLVGKLAGVIDAVWIGMEFTVGANLFAKGAALKSIWG